MRAPFVVVLSFALAHTNVALAGNTCATDRRIAYRCETDRGFLYRNPSTGGIQLQVAADVFDARIGRQAPGTYSMYLVDKDSAPTAKPVVSNDVTFRLDTMPTDGGLEGTFTWCSFAPLSSMLSHGMFPACVSEARDLTLAKLDALKPVHRDLPGRARQNKKPAAVTADTSAWQLSSSAREEAPAKPATPKGKPTCENNPARFGTCRVIGGHLYRGVSDGRLKLIPDFVNAEPVFAFSGSRALDAIPLPAMLKKSLAGLPSATTIAGSFKVCALAPFGKDEVASRRPVNACIAQTGSYQLVAMDKLEIKFE